MPCPFCPRPGPGARIRCGWIATEAGPCVCGCHDPLPAIPRHNGMRQIRKSIALTVRQVRSLEATVARKRAHHCLMISPELSASDWPKAIDS